MLKQVWPVALVLCVCRGGATWIAAYGASKLARDPPTLKIYGAAGLVSQAGLTLGLSVVIANAFPTIAKEFRTLAIACVAINEMAGPILLKWALDRSGESERTRKQPDSRQESG